MAGRLSVELMREKLVRPWNVLLLFQTKGPLSRVPEHYKKFYWQWRHQPRAPVHYIPKPGNYHRLPTGEVQPVQNVPIPLKEPKELHEGIWGGEAVIKGYQKRHPTTRRVTHYWVPHIKKSVLYSEILDRYMRVTVTDRTLRLIDQHYGFDSYILETPPADLMSSLALRLRREMLLALVQGTLHPNNPTKREELLHKYHKHIIPEEEADWFGLTIPEAISKQQALEQAASPVDPLKHLFRTQLLEQLKEQQAEERPEESSTTNWLDRVNPFAKK